MIKIIKSYNTFGQNIFHCYRLTVKCNDGVHVKRSCPVHFIFLFFFSLQSFIYSFYFCVIVRSTHINWLTFMRSDEFNVSQTKYSRIENKRTNKKKKLSISIFGFNFFFMHFSLVIRKFKKNTHNYET